VQLHDLSDVLSADGPFVTVHVGAESAVEQAADRYDLAWKNVLKQLESEGVAEPVRDAIDAARGDHADGPARLVVASTADAKVLLAEPASSRSVRSPGCCRWSPTSAPASRTSSCTPTARAPT
jgi:hypothetical protein